jgi:hypothetical protein
LDLLLDEKGLDGGSRIATAGLDYGGDISLHLIGVTCGLGLLGNCDLLCEP